MKIVSTIVSSMLIMPLSTAAFSSDLRTMCPTYASLDGIFGSTSSIARISSQYAGQVLRLNAEYVSVNSGSNVSELIKENGFMSDQANLNLVAAINPHIDDINKLAINDGIFIPKLEAYDGEGWKAFVPAYPVDGFAVDRQLAPRAASQLVAEAAQAAERLQASISLETEVDPDVREQAGGYAEFLRDELSSEKFVVTSWGNSRDLFAYVDSQNTYAARHVALAERVSSGYGDFTVNELGPVISAISDHDQSSAANIKLTISVFSQDRQPVNGLLVKYMSAGTFELGCGKEHGLEFGSRSHKASHTLRPANYYFWVVDPSDGRTSKASSIKMQVFDTREVHREYYIEWE
jgi:hypothetical protein